MANTTTAAATIQSKVTTMFDVEDLSVRSEFFKIHGDQGINQFQKLDNMGYTRAVTNRINKQYEKDWISPVIHVGSTITATGNPNEYSFDLGTTALNLDYYETNITAPYTSAGRYKFVAIVGWIIPLKMNGAHLQIRSFTTSGATCTVTVKHINSAKTFTPSDYPAGTILPIVSNSQGEGGDQNEGIVSKPLIDYSYTQNIRTTMNVTGTQLATSSYLKSYSDGKQIVGYYTVGMEDAEYMHALHIDNALLAGEFATDPDIDGDYNEPKFTTEGQIPYISRKGHRIPMLPNSFTPQLFNYNDKLIQSEFGPNVYDWMLGIDLDQQKDNALKMYFDRTEISYVNSKVVNGLFKGNEGLAMDVQFSAMKMGNRTYCFSRADQFSHPRTYGVTGFTTPGMGMAYPIGTKKNLDDTTPGAVKNLPYFGMIFRSMNGYNRRVEFGELRGATNGKHDISADRNKLWWKSEMGCEHVGGNTMILMEP